MMMHKKSQRSDWSMTQTISIQRQNSFVELDRKLNQNKYDRCKLFQCWSSIPSLLRGLLLGTLLGCVLLSIALALWLTKSTTGTNVTTTTATMTATLSALTTATTAGTVTVTYVPTGIYALTIPTCATWSQNGITVAGNTNGTAGSDLESLDDPVSIFVDNNDTLIVADRNNNRVMKYFPNSTIGILIAGNNTPGNDPNELDDVKGVAVDQSGAVIVADSGNYRIQKFVSGSTIGITLVSNSTSNLLGEMRDLHIDVNNNIYITDSDYNEVIKYAPFSTIGIVLAGGTPAGSANNQLSNPYGNFMDENNTLYVADFGNQRIMKYAPGSMNGTIVAGITGSAGSGTNQLQSPASIIVDNNGYIYIADYRNNRIMKWTTNYTAGGTCLVSCAGTVGTADDQLNAPRDLKFDKYGNLYVSDQGNNRVQKFMIQTSTCGTNG